MLFILNIYEIIYKVIIIKASIPVSVSIYLYLHIYIDRTKNKIDECKVHKESWNNFKRKKDEDKDHKESETPTCDLLKKITG